MGDSSSTPPLAGPAQEFLRITLFGPNWLTLDDLAWRLKLIVAVSGGIDGVLVEDFGARGLYQTKRSQSLRLASLFDSTGANEIQLTSPTTAVIVAAYGRRLPAGYPGVGGEMWHRRGVTVSTRRAIYRAWYHQQ